MNTNRELAEEMLLQLPHVRPFTPMEHETLERYKDGTFGLSTLSFALYSNGHNLRGKSRHPYGLMYEDGEAIFSIGFFKKELKDEEYIILVCPRGKDSIHKAATFTQEVLERVPCRGVYIRYLHFEEYRQLLNNGFLPAKENPWHDDSPEEDETLTNSLLFLEELTIHKNVRMSYRR